MPKVNVKDKRRRQLVEANIASIAKRGFTETTITHISEGAGMSRGIVNFYFTTKESMMQATCRYIAEENTSAWKLGLASAEGGTPLQKLHAVIKANFHKSVCNEKRLSVWAAFCGHAATHVEYRKILARYDGEHHAAIAQLWQQIRADEAQSKAKAQEFASHLHAMIRGLWMAYLLSPANNDRETLANVCVAFVESKAGLIPALPVKEVKQVVAPRPAKKAKVPEGQLNFDDLFSVQKRGG